MLTVSINRCFDKFLIMAKRGTLFRALKPGPAALINEVVDQRKVQLRLLAIGELRGGRVLLAVSINRCFDKFLILAKRGTLFRATKK